MHALALLVTALVSQSLYPAEEFGTFSLSATGALKFGVSRASLWSTKDGALQLGNAAATAGVVLDFSTDGTLKCRTFADAADCTLTAASLQTTGTAIASLTNTGDPNTGLSWPGADMLNLDAGGATRMQVATFGSIDVGNHYVKAGNAKGQYELYGGAAAQTLTFGPNPGNASKVTSGLVPRGANVHGFVGRVTVTGTDCTSVNITTDLGPGAVTIAATMTLVQNDVFTGATATGNVSGTCYKVGGCEVTVTGVGANCYSLAIAITSFYSTFTAPTAN